MADSKFKNIAKDVSNVTTGGGTDTQQFMENTEQSWNIGTMPLNDVKVNTKILGNAQLGIGVNAPMLDTATPLVFPPAIIVVLQVPAMYADTDMGYAIKDMFESHATAVTGIDVSYSNEAIGQTLVGADGQNIVSPGKTTRAQQTPSFTFTEVSGNLYWNLMKKWVTDMQNPDTYAIGAGVKVSGGWTMSDYSMVFMAIQPDVTLQPNRIIDAAIFCNVFPQATGDLGMERSLNTMKPMTRTFTFNSILQHNHYTKLLGSKVMEDLLLHNIDYNWATPHRTNESKELNKTGIKNGSETRFEQFGTSADSANGSDEAARISNDQSLASARNAAFPV